MKTKFLLYTCFLFCLYTANLLAQTYTITGEVKGLPDGATITLKLNALTIVGEGKVKQGTFTIKEAYQLNNSMVTLSMEGVKTTIPILLDEMLHIKIDAQNPNQYTVSRSALNADYITYLKMERAMQSEIEAYNETAYDKFEKAQQNNDEKTLHELTEGLNKLQKEKRNLPTAFIKGHPNSELSLLFLITYRETAFRDGKTLDLFQKLATSVQNLPHAKALYKSLAANLVFPMNSVAPNFSAPTPDGKMVSLKESLGKVTVIDFWASWCAPCRVENPNLIRIYNTYKDQGLSVIGVSVDSKKEHWVEAIKQDKLPWIQISNLQGTKDAISKTYQIKSVPTTYVLDKDGKIVGFGLTNKDLEEKIIDLLKK